MSSNRNVSWALARASHGYSTDDVLRIAANYNRKRSIFFAKKIDQAGEDVSNIGVIGDTVPVRIKKTEQRTTPKMNVKR